MSETSEGLRELLVATGQTESGDVVIGVRDSGPGLALAALETLLKAFHTTKPKGFGLGLSICRSIREAHGGRLSASANTPRGGRLPVYAARPSGHCIGSVTLTISRLKRLTLPRPLGPGLSR